MMRVLLTGLGSIGQRHARLLLENPLNIELIAYRSGHSQSGNQFDIPEYTDLSEALQTEPDIAFITNSTHKHVPTATKCAKAGCHLFIEKPLSNTLEGVNELITEVKQRNLTARVGSQLRFDPVLKKLRSNIRNHHLGKVIVYRATASSYLPDWRPDQDYRESYSADPYRGGGVVLDLIHEIDYISWLFGSPTDVVSKIGYTDTLEIDSEAVAEAVFSHENDLIGSIHLDYCRRKPRRTLEVTCENGTIIADLEEQELTIEKSRTEKILSFNYDRNHRFKNQLGHFLENVQSNESSDVDLHEGKEVLKTALKVKGEYDE